jgi:hypothetical protein
MNVNIVAFIPEKQHTDVSDREFLYYITKIRQNQEHTSALSSSSEWRKGTPELRPSAYYQRGCSPKREQSSLSACRRGQRIPELAAGNANLIVARAAINGAVILG